MRARVVRVPLERPLTALEVGERYSHALLVVTFRGAVIGRVLLPAGGTVSAEEQERAIESELGERLWKAWFKAAFARATRNSLGVPREGEVASVSLLVCTRGACEALRGCLESVGGLSTPPLETIVVAAAAPERELEVLCAEHSARCLSGAGAPLVALLNRGITEAAGSVVAIAEDDWRAEPAWLDELDWAFDDPLVMAVTGRVEPVALDDPARSLVELHDAEELPAERVVFEGGRSPVMAAATLGSGHALFRRALFGEVGLLPEGLGDSWSPQRAYLLYRALAAGYRVAFDPGLVVWREAAAGAKLGEPLYERAAGRATFVGRCLVGNREPEAVRLMGRWSCGHALRDLARIVSRAERRLPLGAALREAAAPLAGLRGQLRRGAREEVPRLDAPRAAVPEPNVEIAPGAAEVSLSVVVPSYNRRDRLGEVLTSLASQTYPAERYEVIVVLDGSSDGSAELVRGLELPCRLQLIEQENSGVGASRNRGAEAATEPVILFFDDDILAEPGLVAAHADAHRRARRAELALGYHPPVVPGSDLWSIRIRAWWEDHFRRKGQPGHRWSYVDMCSGNSSISRSAFLDCGSFDEDFLSRGEDWELGLRLLQRGVGFSYHPAARGRHYRDVSFAASLRSRRDEGRNDVLISSKHPGVRDQLRLARLAPLLARSRFARFSYRHPGPTGSVVPPLVRLLGGLERLKLRGAWHSLTDLVMGHAYMAGVAGAAGSLEELEALVSPPAGQQGRPVPIPIWLGETGSLEPQDGVAPVELVLGYAGQPLSSFVATEPGEQWEWNSVTKRATELGLEPVRRALTEPPERFPGWTTLMGDLAGEPRLTSSA